MAYKARKSGVKSGERVSPFARQQNLFAFDDGATVSDYTNATIMMLADIVNGAKVTELKKTISIYNDRARDAASGQSDIFSAELKTKEDILKEVNELLNYGTEESKESALSRADASRRASSESVGAESVEQDGTAGVSREGSADVEDSVQAALTAAEQETNTEPTDAQKEAGNYKKGHVKIDGYNITIENPKGSERNGQDKDGKKWSITMNNTYGYILGTEGVDGDHIDVFLSDNPSEGNVYVVDQVNADGSFDEHKVMYGFPDIESARKAYLSNYEEGWQGLGNITGVSKEEFKKWVDSSHRKTKPFAEYKNVKVEESNTETEEEVLPYNKENSERLSLESEKNADNSAVGYSVTLESKDGTLQRSIFYDGRLIAIQWQSGERIDSIHDVLRSAYNDAPAMNYDLYVPMKVGANESWEIDGRDVLDADHGDIIRFHDEQEMIDFYLKNRNEIDRRNETMQPHSAETRETALRDGLIDKLRSAGIEVITDEEEAQRVLDAANGDVALSRGQKRAFETASVSSNEEHQPTVVSNADGAKVVKNLEKLAEEFENLSNQPKFFIGNVAKALGAEQYGSGSQYATFETKNGQIVTIRLADHNAHTSGFDYSGKDNGISIVISAKKNSGINNDGNAHIVEYYYDAIKLRRANGKPLADIVRAIQQSLYSGEFKDPTGLAEREEVNVSSTANEVKFLRTSSGEAYGFTKDGKIYIDPRKATAETPVHEFTHLWADGLRKANPKAWEQLKSELEKEKDLFDYVKSLYPELSGDDLMDEVFAHFSGRRGAERLRSEQEKMMQKANGIFDKAKITTMFDRLRNMLHDFWAQARDLFAGKTEGIERLSAEVFADMALADLIKGEKPLAEGKKETRFNKAAGLDVRTYDNSNHQTRDEERVTLGELVSGDRQLRDMSDNELDSEYMRLLDVVEKPARIDKLRSSKPVEIKPSDYDGKYKLNAESAQKWIKDNLRGKHVINDTGETVEVSKIGAEEVTSHNRYDEAHLKSISKIPSMLENAVFLGEEANTKGNRKFDSYRYYAVGLNIDGVDYTAKIVIGVKQGKKYYDHRLTQLEKSTLIDMFNQPASGFTTAENASLPPYANGKVKRLLSILQVNVEEISQSEQKMREILDEMKRRRGYDSNTDYQGSLAFNGAAPSRNAYFDSKEERMSAFKSGEFEGDYSLGDYMDNGLDNNDLGWQLANPIAASGRDKATLESIRNLMNVVKNKERRIKMYRAVDASIKENKFRNGDWITPSREYAERHIGLQEWKNGRVIEEEVSVDDIWWNGDDINEWGFDDGKGYAYKNVRNNRKLDDLITRDDNGNVIAPSERFNSRKSDLRFREPEDVYDAGRRSLEETLTQGLIDLSEKNRSDVGLRISAMKAISSNLSELRSAMSRQRDYDKSTVNIKRPFGNFRFATIAKSIPNSRMTQQRYY